MASERIEFRNEKGRLLVGVFHGAEGAAGRAPLIVTCPGLLSTKDGAKHLAFASKAPDLGFSFFRFDFAGLGESEGRFEDSCLTSRLGDLQSALDHLRARGFLDASCPVGLVGSSFGAPVALLGAVRERQAGALVTWAGAFDLEATLAYSAPDSLRLLRAGRTVTFQEEGRVYRLGPAFLEDFARYDVPAEIGKLSGRPSLFIHGAADASVPLAQSEKAHRAAAEPKRLIVYENAGHRLEEAVEQVIGETLAWFGTHLRRG